MARKAGRETGREAGSGPVEKLVEAEVPGQVSEQQLETYDRIESLKERFGDDATGRAQIQRRLKDGRLIGLPSIPALTFDTDLVAKRYGGGRYYVRFYQGRDYLGDIEFELDESLKPEPPEPPKVAAPNGSGEAPTWLMASLDKMSEAIRVLAERPAPTPPAAPDPLAMIRGIAEAARSMIPPAPAAPPPPPQPMSLKDQIGVIRDVVSVGTDILEARGGGGGGEESGDIYMRSVMKLAEPIIDRAAENLRADQRMMAPPTRRALPPATDAAGRPVASSSEGAPMVLPPWVVEIRRLMPVILSRFARGANAENTAYFVLDDLSDVTKVKIAELAARDDFEQIIVQYLPPQMQQKPEWTQEFLMAVQDYLLAPEEEEEDADARDEPPDAAPIVGRQTRNAPLDGSTVGHSPATQVQHGRGKAKGKKGKLADKARDTLAALPEKPPEQPA